MKEETCSGCRFWNRHSEESKMGCCRESPPVITIIGRYNPNYKAHIPTLETCFPDTYQLEWCGKYEENIS